MSSAKPSKPKRRRRWLQFSLRGMLVLTTVAAAVLAWIRSEIDRLHDERSAAAAIYELGGLLYYDRPEAHEFRVPPWLQRAVGKDYFYGVYKVAYAGEEGDRVLELARHLRGPLWLDMRCASVSDDGMRGVATIGGLQWLELPHTPITDASVPSLAVAHRLQLLDVRGTHITQSGADTIRRSLPEKTTRLCWGPAKSEAQRRAAVEMEDQGGTLVEAEFDERFACTRYSVYMDGTRWDRDSTGTNALIDLDPDSLSLRWITLNERDTKVFARLQSLDWLSLEGDSLTSMDLKCAGVVPNLRQLEITGKFHEDLDLRPLRSLHSLERLEIAVDGPPLDLADLGTLLNLKELRLCGPAISDQSLAGIAALANIEELDVNLTAITRKGLQSLRGMKGLRRLHAPRWEEEDGRWDKDGELRTLRCGSRRWQITGFLPTQASGPNVSRNVVRQGRLQPRFPVRPNVR